MKVENSQKWQNALLRFKTNRQTVMQEATQTNPPTYTFAENGTGTILFYQNYGPLFYNQSTLRSPIAKI